MVDDVCIAGKAPAIEHLVLVAHVHIEVLVKGFIDTEKEAVLIDSGSWTFASRYTHRIQVDKYFIIGDQRPIRSLWDREIRAEHLAEPHGGAVCMFDPPFLQPGAA